ncbi:MAG: hypothetical protein D6689_13690 [Deltaproteobacteria bacterium]|nr:MAG: hypothetical protein D6689_13690 [Deltaproteobacteria bacterium]
MRGALLENLGLKFIAFVLALTVFILVHSDEDAVAGAYVAISYTLPEDQVLVSDRLDQVRITVKGSWRRIKRFDERELEPVRIDLRRFKNGDLIFRSDMFRLPPGLTIVSIDPPTMPVRFEPRTTKRVPIAVATRGDPARGYGVARLEARVVPCDRECDTVEVTGAASYVARTDRVFTEEVSLVGRRESFTDEVGLAPPGPFVDVVGQPRVQVTVEIAEALSARELPAVPVRLRPGPDLRTAELSAFRVEPAAVKIVLRGAARAIEQVADDQVVPFVDVLGDDDIAGRRRRATVIVEGLPPGVAVEIDPRTVTLVYEPRSP